jgi:hypothetical protein
MTQEEIIKVILDEAIYIYKTIDPGMLENVYKTCLAYRLGKRGLLKLKNRSPYFSKRSEWNVAIEPKL